LLNPSIMLGEPPELQPQYQGRSYVRQDPHSSHSAKHAIQNQFFNPFYDPDQTNFTIYPDLHHSTIQLWTGYWLRYCKDPLGYEYYFPEQSHTLHRKAMDYLSDMNVMQDFKLRTENKNENTIQTFQKEFRNMYQEIDILKGKCEEWRMRYETDTGALMDICEKQKEELHRWSGGLPNTTIPLETPQPRETVQTKKQVESRGTDQGEKDESIETIKRECESWKQKCLELQVEVLQKKRTQTLQGDNNTEIDKDQEMDKMKKYVLQLQSTIMQQRQQIQQLQQDQQSNGSDNNQPLKRVDSWESINSTWRAVSGANEGEQGVRK
jgi:outer membrane murein-binding lipoprotein Lpp